MCICTLCMYMCLFCAVAPQSLLLFHDIFKKVFIVGIIIFYMVKDKDTNNISNYFILAIFHRVFTRLNIDLVLFHTSRPTSYPTKH